MTQGNYPISTHNWHLAVLLMATLVVELRDLIRDRHLLNLRLLNYEIT